MLLAIDIGNTNIVIGFMDGTDIRHESRIATDLIKTSDQYCFDLKNTLSLFEIAVGELADVIISSVVPPVLNSLRTAVIKLTGKLPLVVDPDMKTGLKIAIDEPRQLGSDMIVSAVAALAEYRPPLIIIDMGTATTLSVIDENGVFVGASISPGVRISSQALSSGTALLPGIELDRPERAIGTNTIDSMRSGIMLGSACMLDGMIERIEEELGMPATVLATGGIARFIIPMCRRKIAYDRNLLLKGLSFLYQANTEK